MITRSKVLWVTLAVVCTAGVVVWIWHSLDVVPSNTIPLMLNEFEEVVSVTLPFGIERMWLDIAGWSLMAGIMVAALLIECEGKFAVQIMTVLLLSLVLFGAMMFEVADTESTTLVDLLLFGVGMIFVACFFAFVFLAADIGILALLLAPIIAVPVGLISITGPIGLLVNGMAATVWLVLSLALSFGWGWLINKGLIEPTFTADERRRNQSE